jgi:hypothetical protein
VSDLKVAEWTSLSVDEAFKRRDDAKAAMEANDAKIAELTIKLSALYDERNFLHATYDFADRILGLAIQAEDAK